MFRKPTNQTNQSDQLNQFSIERSLIELLQMWPDATTKEIMKKLKIIDNQVKYYIKKLNDNGKIERVGTNRKGLWKIIIP